MTTINWETETCATCGVHFQIPEDYHQDRVEDGKLFYCPNGHEQQYTECTDEKLEKITAERDALRVEVRKLKCRLIGNNGIVDKVRVWWRGALK